MKTFWKFFGCLFDMFLLSVVVVPFLLVMEMPGPRLFLQLWWEKSWAGVRQTWIHFQLERKERRRGKRLIKSLKKSNQIYYGDDWKTR